jgi:hypothetical protein
MIKVNDIEIPIYQLDNINSFYDRIASYFNTLREYLYFPNKLIIKDLYEVDNIKIVDILKDMKISAENNSSITELINTCKQKGKNNDFIKEKIIPYWFSYNTKLYDITKVQTEIINSKIGLQPNKIKDLFNKTNKEKNKEKLENKILENKKNVKTFEKKCKIFEKIEGNPSTDFIILSTEFIMNLDINISLLELFNTVILTEYIPFVTVKKFYKISKDFKIPYLSDWINSEDDTIILKVAYKKDFEKFNISNYQDTIIKIDPISKDIYIKIKIKIDKNNINKDEYIKRSFDIFKGININIKDKQETEISGKFNFPVSTLDKYVFLDLVMNDDLFNFINIDESLKATKKKSNLYIHFNHQSTGYITATIVEKNALKSDLLDSEIFPIGDPYIRVKVTKANNSKSVEIFKNMLGKLFELYNKKEREIIDFYTKYIDNFGEREVEEINIKEKDKKDIAPEIFINNYTTKCQPQTKEPVIIPEKKALKMGQEFVMKFPRDIQEDSDIKKYDSDGVNQQYYICKDAKYKYPGLIENTLENRDNYPYLPCCFEKNQTEKSKYLNYYKNEDILDDNKSIEKQKSLKFAKNNSYSSLPENIEKLFTFIYNIEGVNYNFTRKGVYPTKNSFLNCVLIALENDFFNNKSIKDITDIEDFLTDQRENVLATDELVSLCRQEMYDKTNQEIIDILKNPDIYLDPKLFIHLLEGYFECNIYLFTNMNNENGEMILPNFTQSYYTHKNNYDYNIFIYEHLGNKIDRVKYGYPRCELICRYSKEYPEGQDNFNYKETENIRKVFASLKESYSLDKLIQDTYMPMPKKKIEIVSQSIDLYGKTRRINIKFNNKIISLSTTPIQPIGVIEDKTNELYVTDIDTVNLLLKEFNKTSDKVENDNFYITIGNVQVYISTKKENKKSYLEKYNKNKKIARYLTEYTLWLYSKYLNSKNITEMNDDTIDSFAKNYFKIVPKFKYGDISKNFKLKNPSLIEKDKLIVHDEETIKRLIYVLRLNIQRDNNKVLNYHKKLFIENYYVDLTDFTEYPNQLILFGEESIQNWVNENNVNYKLYNNIQVGNIPYFFKNELIDDKVYLAQNTTSLGKASNIATTWIKENYNLNIQIKDKIPVSFTLYSYENAFNIKKYQIQSKPYKNSKDIKILGYKIKNVTYYTVLLSL